MGKVATKSDDAQSRDPALDADDLTILRELDRAATTLDQYALEEKTPMTRKTIGKRLTVLRKAGLTHRPKGERGGEAITKEGRRALHSRDAQSTR